MSRTKASAAIRRHDDPGLLAVVFAALGDPRRLEVVERLGRDGPMSIAGLAAGSDVTRQAIAKHVYVLARAGVVRGQRHGRERRWELDRRPLVTARRYLKLMAKRWDDRLDRLKAAVER